MAANDTPWRNSDDEHLDGDVDVSRDGLANQCLLYLLGELSPDRAQSFEQQVLVSSEAANEVARQSKLLSFLGGGSIPTSNDVIGNDIDIDARSVVRNASSLRGFALMVAAIAAGLLLVLSFRPADDEGAPEIDEARIAEAWAATDTAWSELSILNDESETIFSESFASIDSSDFVGPFGDEAVPSWMLVALDSSSDLLDATADDEQGLNREPVSGRL